MIVRVDPDYLEHASKSKYKGGFTKDGKNTSAYNHDYYMKNKDKWKDNEDSESDNPKEPYAIEYAGSLVGNGYYDKKTGEYSSEINVISSHGHTSRKRNGGKFNVMDSKTTESYAKKEGLYDRYVEGKKNGEAKEVKSAKVYKRGEGIGGGPSGTKDYSNRSSVSINKRKKGRKPVGKVWTAKY